MRAQVRPMSALLRNKRKIRFSDYIRLAAAMKLTKNFGNPARKRNAGS